MNHYSLSIIVPTYDVAPYIRKCLESVALQIYTDSVECLIIDDCGSDDSIQIASDFIKNYNGPICFRIIHREKNGGLSAARNTGIIEAKGTYIYLLDSDDWIIPECLSLMIGCVRNFPEAEMVCAGAICSTTIQQLWLGIEHKELAPYFDNQKAIKEMLLEKSIIPLTAWNKLVRRDFIISHNLYFKEGIIHEDEHWNWYMSKCLSKLAICKKNTYNYVTREGSIMTSNIERSQKTWLLLINEFISSIDSNLLGCQYVYLFKYFRDNIDDPNRRYYKENLQLFDKFIKKTYGLYKVILLTYRAMPVNLKAKIKVKKLFTNALCNLKRHLDS